jgi:hypothetical protein
MVGNPYLGIISGLPVTSIGAVAISSKPDCEITLIQISHHFADRRSQVTGPIAPRSIQPWDHVLAAVQKNPG